MALPAWLSRTFAALKAALHCQKQGIVVLKMWLNLDAVVWKDYFTGCGRNNELILNTNKILLKVIKINFSTHNLLLWLNCFCIYVQFTHQQMHFFI